MASGKKKQQQIKVKQKGRDSMIYLELFWSFFQIGLFSIGGGYAAMPLIQNQVVDVHPWLTMTQFADIMTIAEMTPGPIAINSATFVGIQVAGLLGGGDRDRRLCISLLRDRDDLSLSLLPLSRTGHGAGDPCGTSSGSYRNDRLGRHFSDYHGILRRKNASGRSDFL